VTGTATDPIDAARAALADGKPIEAVTALRGVLGYPGGAGVPGERVAAGLAILGDAAAAVGDQTLAGAAHRLAADIDDPDAMYDLGYQLVEARLPSIAATILQRCHAAVGNSEQVVTELVAALEAMLAYRDAAAFLRDHPLLADSFMCRYLYAFNATMAGDLAAVRAIAPQLAPASPQHEVMAARIDGFLARADRLAGVAPLDASDLRGWHHVISGGVLAHLSPFGFDEPMRGRYAWLQDSGPRINTGVARLARVLAAWNVAPPCVYAPPGRGHDIVAALVAAKLGVPVAPWPAVGVPAPGVVAIYDLGAVDPRDLARLVDVRPDQIVYAHAVPWTVDGGVAPDVVTLLAQTLVPPWDEGLALDADRAVVRRPPDERSSTDIAAEVARAGELAGEDVACDDLAALDRLVIAAGPPAGPRRERMWAGSPVASNRFD
jgi:hypothetical protein